MQQYLPILTTLRVQERNSKAQPSRWAFLFLIGAAFPSLRPLPVATGFLSERRPMPEKDPTNWAALWDAVSNSAAWQGAIMASVIAFLRVLYDGKETRWTRIGLESIICGLLSFSASSSMGFFGMPESLSITVGGSIGFLGVTTIREYLVKWAGKRTDK